jgi:hypothetical protein
MNLDLVTIDTGYIGLPTSALMRRTERMFLVLILTKVLLTPFKTN